MEPIDASTQPIEEQIAVAGMDLAVVKGGTGRPLLVLHEELGYPGWLGWQSALARANTVDPDAAWWPRKSSPHRGETAKELGLQDSFERRIGERPLPASGQPEPVASVELLAC